MLRPSEEPTTVQTRKSAGLPWNGSNGFDTRPTTQYEATLDKTSSPVSTGLAQLSSPVIPRATQSFRSSSKPAKVEIDFSDFTDDDDDDDEDEDDGFAQIKSRPASKMTTINSSPRCDDTGDMDSDDGFAVMDQVTIKKPAMATTSTSIRSSRTEKIKVDKKRAAQRQASDSDKKRRPVDILNNMPRIKAAKYEQGQNKPAGFDLSSFQFEPGKMPWEEGNENAGGSKKELSDAQKKVIYLAESGVNVFFTGAAGTGKSHLLREMIKRLQHRYGNGVKVTATTGLAALNIGGTTLHRWAGLGVAQGTVEQLTSRLRKSKAAFQRWRATKVLIIDEVSMLDGVLFDKLCEVGKAVLKSDAPFGGIQLILTGDFFQLPPVKAVKMCFQAKNWSTAIHRTVVLSKVFRQEGDNALINMLNALRTGSIDSRIESQFHELNRPVHYTDGIEPSRLYPTKREVAAANNEQLSRLKGHTFKFLQLEVLNDDYLSEERQRAEFFETNFMSLRELVLKVDAQVMLIQNSKDQDGLVNGSTGLVVTFVSEYMYADLVGRYQENAEFIKLYNLLLNSSTYALTPAMEAEANRYNFLSDLLRAAEMLGRENDRDRKYPLVKFAFQGSFKYKHIVPVTFEMMKADGKTLHASATQLPLIPSWAISIHKSQGQTLERVVVDLARSFEKGQVYVALSRAVSKDCLQVLNFSRHKVMVSEDVKRFYTSLESI
ncbi:ATP-dependent DNA helicase Rrm3p [Trichomonascus vanleenenianus]|uniref:DEAD/DEAH box helicase n=1 Tax=Trichomonascus vanleenenianus TaxID=2268995 RepID=UPI003EC99715